MSAVMPTYLTYLQWTEQEIEVMNAEALKNPELTIKCNLCKGSGVSGHKFNSCARCSGDGELLWIEFKQKYQYQPPVSEYFDHLMSSVCNYFDNDQTLFNEFFRKFEENFPRLMNKMSGELHDFRKERFSEQRKQITLC